MLYTLPRNFCHEKTVITVKERSQNDRKQNFQSIFPKRSDGCIIRLLREHWRCHHTSVLELKIETLKECVPT